MQYFSSATVDVEVLSRRSPGPLRAYAQRCLRTAWINVGQQIAAGTYAPPNENLGLVDGTDWSVAYAAAVCGIDDVYPPPHTEHNAHYVETLARTLTYVLRLHGLAGVGHILACLVDDIGMAAHVRAAARTPRFYLCLDTRAPPAGPYAPSEPISAIGHTPTEIEAAYNAAVGPALVSVITGA